MFPMFDVRPEPTVRKLQSIVSSWLLAMTQPNQSHRISSRICVCVLCCLRVSVCANRLLMLSFVADSRFRSLVFRSKINKRYFQQLNILFYLVLIHPASRTMILIIKIVNTQTHVRIKMRIRKTTHQLYIFIFILYVHAIRRLFDVILQRWRQVLNAFYNFFAFLYLSVGGIIVDITNFVFFVCCPCRILLKLIMPSFCFYFKSVCTYFFHINYLFVEFHLGFD